MSTLANLDAGLTKACSVGGNMQLPQRLQLEHIFTGSALPPPWSYSGGRTRGNTIRRRNHRGQEESGLQEYLK